MTDKSGYFFGKVSIIENQPSISAKVDIYIYEVSNDITLTFTDLKLCCFISTPSFDLEHPDFNRFENVIMFYANCLQNLNPFEHGT
jgi:hypothetical protein